MNSLSMELQSEIFKPLSWRTQDLIEKESKSNNPFSGQFHNLKNKFKQIQKEKEDVKEDCFSSSALRAYLTTALIIGFVVGVVFGVRALLLNGYKGAAIGLGVGGGFLYTVVTCYQTPPLMTEDRTLLFRAWIFGPFRAIYKWHTRAKVEAQTLPEDQLNAIVKQLKHFFQTQGPHLMKQIQAKKDDLKASADDVKVYHIALQELAKTCEFYNTLSNI